jgi:predicted glycoside hydrolase/deacetylase ChbG (UPF0249 family)
MSVSPLRPLIVCADDYAISPGVSRGIRELAEAGRISATGAMTAMPHWPEAAAAIKPLTGRVAIGLHLTLTDQRPLGPMTRLAPGGRFPTIAAISRNARLGRLPREEIAAELARQLDAFETHLGRPPDFIDGHQHVHNVPVVRDLVLDAIATRLAAHRTWVRDCWDDLGALARRASFEGALVAILGYGLHRRARAKRIVANRGFTGVYPFGSVSLASEIPRMLAGAGEHTMLMVHPGHPDAELAAVDPWVEPREGEWADLMSDALPRTLAARGFRIAAGAPFPG